MKDKEMNLKIEYLARESHCIYGLMFHYLYIIIGLCFITLGSFLEIDFLFIMSGIMFTLSFLCWVLMLYNLFKQGKIKRALGIAPFGEIYTKK